MKREVNEILQELYELDPNLVEKEAELTKIISKMIKVKPEVTLDKQFRTELKQQILSELEKQESGFSIKNLLGYVGIFASGAIALALIINIFPNIISKPVDTIIDKQTGNLNLAFNTSIEKLDSKRAFGDLNIGELEEGIAGVGGGGVMGMGGDVMFEGSSKMTVLPDPDYKPKIYVYNYKEVGELPEISENMYVYKKDNKPLKISDSDIKKIFNTDIIDLDKFKNLGISNLNLYEDAKNGYNINLDLQVGTLNVYRNYNMWPQRDYMQEKRLSISDVPSDEKIISIAKSFIEKYSINLDIYGNLVVDDIWRKQYENSDNKDDYYIPTIINVISQLVLDDIGVYETYGNPYGLNTTVDINDMQVNSIGSIEKINLVGSEYPLITDKDEILNQAKKGTYFQNPRIYGETKENFEEIQVEIGNPKLVYLRKYTYKEGKSEEYFVPGLMFEVLTPSNNEKGIYPGEYVTVPLVKDFIESENSFISEPYIY
ncbi:MAG: hypothetical protein PHH06_02015 [Candidatus Gracilibacteria bacterium]|nr:hypothetical protein [Candidatus Gracilibacteria bacterium]